MLGSHLIKDYKQFEIIYLCCGLVWCAGERKRDNDNVNDNSLMISGHLPSLIGRERESERERERQRERGGGGEREIVHMYAWLCVHMFACRHVYCVHTCMIFWFFFYLFLFTQTNKYMREKLTLCCGGAVVYPAVDCLQRHSVSDAHATWTRCAGWMGGCALLHSQWNSVSAVRHSTAFSSVF